MFNYNHPILPIDELVSLVIDAQAGDVAARDKVIECNMRFVLMIAKKYYNQNGYFDLDDLIVLGVEGLMIAIERYDPKYKTAFTTYAFFWIRAQIRRDVMRHCRGLTLPYGKSERLANYYRLRSTGLSRQDATVEARLTDKEVSDLIDNGMEVLLDTPVFSNTGSCETIGDRLVGENSVNEDDLSTNLFVKSLLDAAKLTPREEATIITLFGLDDGIEKTVKEASAILGVTGSHQSVSDMKRNALRKLKKTARRMEDRSCA